MKGQHHKLLKSHTLQPQYISLMRYHIQDYEGFFSQQLSERKLFKYPPFYRLISITLKHKNNRNLDIVSDLLASILRHSFSDRVLGPEYPIVSKIRNYYHKQILLKIEQGSSLAKAKTIIKGILVKLRQRKDFRSVRIIVDVDPL